MLLITVLLLLSVQTQPSSIISAKVVNVVITSRKFDESISFYGSTFGWTSFYRDKTSCFFRAGGVNVVIVRAGPHTVPSSICLDLAVSDVESAEARLTSHGIHLETKTSTIATLRDPDGNLVELVRG